MRIVLVVAALLLAACGGGAPAEPTSRPRPASDATLQIVEPQDGAVIESSTVTVRVQVEGARILEEATVDVRPDEGHIHITLDGKLVSLVSGLTEQVPDVAKGTHVLEVEFVAGDHAPFHPRVRKQVAFEVL